jgi:hypothetical protein
MIYYFWEADKSFGASGPLFLASPAVGLCPLATHRERKLVPDALVAFNPLQSLDRRTIKPFL